jgi:XRE family aerobic/anaerobic benzoate catabolism transcriptional regulator
MGRVLAQGDRRPMSGNREAMEDLKRILESRAQFYSKADKTLDTSELSLEAAFAGLTEQLRGVLAG